MDELELVKRQLTAMTRVVKLQEEAMATSPAHEMVLGKWRQTVFELLVQRSLAPPETAVESTREDLNELDETRLELEVALEKATALEARCLASEGREAKAAADADAARARVDQVERCRTADVSSLRALKAAADVAQQSFASEADLLVSLAKHDENAARLEACAKRLAVMRRLFAQRDVKLRNAAAALEADRRLWDRERRDAELKALGQAGASVSEFEATPLPSLRPEAEALMRSVFCDLDIEGRGAVARGALAAGLRADARLGRLMRHWVGALAWKSALDAIDTGLGQQLRDDDDERDDVTWGEFLLLFVARERRSTTPPAQLEAALRLSLPVPHEDTPEESSSFDALGVEALRAEVGRLARDRSALVRALKASEIAAARARDQAGLQWRHKERAANLKIDQLERDLRAQAQLLRDAEAAATRLRERADADLAVHASRAQSVETSLRTALANKDADLDAQTRDAHRAADEAAAERRRLETRAAAAEHDRDAQLAQLQALERDAARFKDDLAHQQADFAQRTQAQLQAHDNQLAALRRERDALLRILREHRLAQKHSSSGRTRRKPSFDDEDIASTSAASGPPPAVREDADPVDRVCLESLRAITDDLLEDDDDDFDDDTI